MKRKLKPKEIHPFPSSIVNLLKLNIIKTDEKNEIETTLKKWVNEDKDKTRDRLLSLMSWDIDDDKTNTKRKFALRYIHQITNKLFQPFSLFKSPGKVFEIINDPKKFDKNNPRHKRSVHLIKEENDRFDKWAEMEYALKKKSVLCHPKYKNLIPESGKMKRVIFFYEYLQLMKMEDGSYVPTNYMEFEKKDDIAYIISEKYMKCSKRDTFKLPDGNAYTLVKINPSTKKLELINLKKSRKKIDITIRSHIKKCKKRYKKSANKTKKKITL